ncbi:hypothetical protein QZH41_003684 [Actinostola sp. cb2023]|nr:hypothetical protein QZH41_003684 [Actinostola sp. cb2023]
MSMIPPGSPARLFAPSTSPCMNSECHCANPSCPHRAKNSFKNSSPKDGSPSHKISEKISMPTAKDPLSLEKTAKDMLDVVSGETHGWNAFEEAYSHLQNGCKVEVNSGKITEEDIYQILLRHASNGELPNTKELSSILAKYLKDLLTHNESTVKQLLTGKSKMEDILEATKRDHTNRVEELYHECRKSKQDLRLCQARYRDETHELKNRINSLEAELRRQKFDKEGSGCSGSKESLEVLQQEVRDMSVKLEQKDSFCRELENELNSLHSWIKAQTYHPTSTILYGYRPHRPESRTVIQSVQYMNGNSDKPTPKSNGILRRHDSSEEDV